MAGKKKSALNADAPAWPLDKRLPAHKMVDAKQFANTDAALVETTKIQEIANLLWFHEGTSETERHAKIIKAIDLFESIKPADGIEAMLATQMVGTHHAAMECLRRAMIKTQSLDGINVALTQAQRLMALYAQQMAALDKHRGKGQQKITVERVQVAPGGQAIVGNVQNTATPASAASPSGEPATLDAPILDAIPLHPQRDKRGIRR